MAYKILLADDSVTAQNLGKKILSEGGYDVIAVSNGAAAMKKIASERPHLLILDVYMPGYSGLEVCEKIKRSPETADTPVLLTVAPMEPFNEREGNRVNADGIIVKPFEASELLPKIEKFQQQWASSIAATAPTTSPQVPQETAPKWQEQESFEPEEIPPPAPSFDIPQEFAAAPAFGMEFVASNAATTVSSPEPALPELSELPLSRVEEPEPVPQLEVITSSDEHDSDSEASVMSGFDTTAARLLLVQEQTETLPENLLAEESLDEDESAGLPELGHDYNIAAKVMEFGESKESAAEFHLPESGQPFPQAEAEWITPEVSQFGSFESTSLAGADGNAPSLVELNHLTSNGPEMPPLLELETGEPKGELEKSLELGHSSFEEGALPQDPELMVDRTEMVQFATRFGTDKEVLVEEDLLQASDPEQIEQSKPASEMSSSPQPWLENACSTEEQPVYNAESQQPNTLQVEEATMPVAASSTDSEEISTLDAHAVAEAVEQVLARLRPQIVAEVVRELTR